MFYVLSIEMKKSGDKAIACEYSSCQLRNCFEWFDVLFANNKLSGIAIMELVDDHFVAKSMTVINDDVCDFVTEIFDFEYDTILDCVATYERCCNSKE